jgi:ATP-binding cassette subfamily C protein LapB
MPSSCSGELRVEQAAFAFNDKLAALQPLTLTINAGERIAIVGPIGSGKSTLIRLLSGLYRPMAGKLLLDGVDMALLAPSYLRTHIGYLPQDVRLLHGTLRDNLTLGITPPNDSALIHAARLTGLDRVISAHPQGMDLPIQEGGRGLSGGQRQLVGLTRLLLSQPTVLLLDEPTAAMDAELEANVMQRMLSSLTPSATVVFVTHKASLLRLVDRVIVMDQGRVLIDGPRNEVLAKLTSTAPTGAGTNLARNSTPDHRQGLVGETL